MANPSSFLIISLDFELLWGVRDSRGKEYHQQLLNVHEVVPKLLALFEKYEVACTWATVGALLSKNKQNFEELKPTQYPSYKDKNFSPYPEIDEMLKLDEKLLFASQLVRKIISTDKQELASHTFCHYYCLEDGQSIEEFRADLQSNSVAASHYDIHFNSLVFPRNQFNGEYLQACADAGLVCYRGNPSHWAYQPENREGRSVLRRAFRLLDSYIPLSGSLRQKPLVDSCSGMVDVPASLFFRPWNKKLAVFEALRLWRIKWSMTRTAKKGGLCHLWWHPHNFGRNVEQNMSNLEQVLRHYKILQEKYDFKSATMEQAAQEALVRNGK
ncbi:polysaccharide deacetylase family protein [Litorilituus lipolyticus]|uniref:Polysaccharide deacetylase n=1 Tax=Litorilituus lipolyticus TaxID=2491017 RepID=A0A502L9K2_9GAMM|nr:polysaccharide deacetylase family protein [Litorilituus lipolyticus]TPH18951.1 polysaccharide deacetylase [Litorilituus lipolyticus]